MFMLPLRNLARKGLNMQHLNQNNQIKLKSNTVMNAMNDNDKIHSVKNYHKSS